MLSRFFQALKYIATFSLLISELIDDLPEFWNKSINGLLS